ncbi:MAG: hypothetical protein ACTSWN_00210 [Promethearchaeota archaeon]
MSLLPEDDDNEVVSLLPEEEEDIPMFIDDGERGPDKYEEIRKKVIPKYINLMPKRAMARQMGLATLLVDVLFGFLIYRILTKHGLDVMTIPDWKTSDILPNIMAILTDLVQSRADLFIIIFFAVIMTLIGSVWISSEKSVSVCPVCKKKNYKNYYVCTKCDYIYMTRDIINKEIISCKFNNLDSTPEDIRQEFLDRKLVDLDADYIKKVLARNHLLVQDGRSKPPSRPSGETIDWEELEKEVKEAGW